MTVENALKRLRADPRNALAWETIATNVYQPLLAYVGSLLVTFRIGAAETAEDIVHQALLRFYERTIDGKLHLESAPDVHKYLRVSCRNLLVDKYRRDRHAERFVNFLDLRFENAFQTETSLYRSIFLKEIVSKLPDGCAELFEHYIIEQMTAAEIADRLGVPPATFYSRWYRCIEKIREILMEKKPLANR